MRIDAAGVDSTDGEDMSGVHFVVQWTNHVNVARGGVEAEAAEGVAADEEVSDEAVGAFVTIGGFDLTDVRARGRVLGDGKLLQRME